MEVEFKDLKVGDFFGNPNLDLAICIGKSLHRAKFLSVERHKIMVFHKYDNIDPDSFSFWEPDDLGDKIDISNKQNRIRIIKFIFL